MNDPEINPPGLTYRDAGVDIDAQDEGLRRIKEMLHATRTKGVIADLGSFGGMFAPDLTGTKSPVDSCGTAGNEGNAVGMAYIAIGSTSRCLPRRFCPLEQQR